MSLNTFDLPKPYGHCPPRRPHSIRRTSSIDLIWPEGRGGPLTLFGAARDLYTGSDHLHPEQLAFDTLRARIGPDNHVDAIRSEGSQAQLQSLVGQPCIGGFRRAYLDLVGSEVPANAPLIQLLDDVIGSVVVSDWAWSTRPEQIAAEEKNERKERLQGLAGVCTGFASGSSALVTDGDFQWDRSAVVLPLPLPDDPHGWHPLHNYADMTLRRARCMDLWWDGDINISSVFQDSALQRDGHRSAVHEYSLLARFEPDHRELVQLDIQPHVLPYPECPGAMRFTQELIGVRLADIKPRVLEQFRRERGCTHLNDVLRALSDLDSAVDRLRPE